MNIRSLSSIGSAFSAPDAIILVTMLLIIVSGFFLESTQIISQAVYDEMVEEYSDLEDEEDLTALARFWEAKYGVIFSNSEKRTLSGQEIPVKNESLYLELGAELNENYCLECHHRPVNAFLSYSLSRLISPAGHFLNSMRADLWFWYIHVFCSFFALALLPFTKSFHLISTPLSLVMSRSNMHFKSRNRSPETRGERESVDTTRQSRVVEPATALKRAIALDACVQCGACSKICSVAPMVRTTGNRDILPSEKIRSITGFVLDRKDTSATAGLARGSHICTDCFRCNEICPAGIDLKDIWSASQKSLDLKGFPATHARINRQNTMTWAEHYKKDHPRQTFREKQDRFDKIPSDPAIFSKCVQCSICSNVCPVVEVSRSHSHDPGLTPQQVMNLLRLELRDVAMFSSMVWNCATCYMCQEHCPQGIQVADILCSLRNRTCEYLESEQSKNKGDR